VKAHALKMYPRGILARPQERSERHQGFAPITAYPDPQPTDSLEGWHRSRHEDIRHLTDEQLARERTRAALRNAYDDTPTPWFVDRLRRLDAEHARRTRGPR